jgi:hypothetical protein
LLKRNGTLSHLFNRQSDRKGPVSRHFSPCLNWNQCVSKMFQCIVKPKW